MKRDIAGLGGGLFFELFFEQEQTKRNKTEIASGNGTELAWQEHAVFRW